MKKSLRFLIVKTNIPYCLIFLLILSITDSSAQTAIRDFYGDISVNANHLAINPTKSEFVGSTLEVSRAVNIPGGMDLITSLDDSHTSTYHFSLTSNYDFSDSVAVTKYVGVIETNDNADFISKSGRINNSFTKHTETFEGNKNNINEITTGSSLMSAVGDSSKIYGARSIIDCQVSPTGNITVPRLCAGQSLTLRATSSDPLATYAWSRTPSGFTATTSEITLQNLTVGNSVYTVLITNSNLCTSALTANVVVNSIPTVNVTSTAFCEGATGTLTASGATNYSWTGPNGAFTTTTAMLSVSQPGIYTVTGNSNGCTANVTTSVTVFPKTALTATGAVLCLGGGGTISVLPAGLKYAWAGPASFGSTEQTPIITNATAANQGTYTVSATDRNMCTSTATIAVTVGAALNVFPISNSPVCVGTRLDLSIMGGRGATYFWTSPKGATSNIQNPFTQTATFDNEGLWTVEVTNADGCRGSGSVLVDIKPAPTGVTATVTAPGCVGDDITLSSSPTGAKSYEWTGTPSFTSTVQNPVLRSATADNYTFTVKVTNTDGCTALATTSTAIYTAPSVRATSNSPVCGGNTINLGVSTSATQFVWTGPNNFSASTKTPIISGAKINSSGLYTVIVTNVNLCTATATVSVMVSPTLSGSEDLSICASVSTAQLTVISGSTWIPKLSNPAVTTVDAAGKVSGLTVNGSYVFYTTNANGCNDTVKVFRNENLNAGKDVVICSPSTKAKLLKLNTGQTWTYFANGSSLPPPIIDANGNVANIAQDGTYLFILEQKGVTTCADTVAVIRKLAPNAGIDQTVLTGGRICEPVASAKLQAAGINQVWSVATNSVGFGTVAIDASGMITKMTTNGIYTFVLSQGECTDTVKVQRVAKPLAGLDIEICSDAKAVKLSNAPTGMTWSSISTNPSGTLINANTGEVTGLTTVGEYKFILTNAGGCTDTVSVKTKATPSFEVSVFQATCTLGTANQDAKFVVVSLDANATYDYTEGLTYTGTKTYTSGKSITTSVTGLSNPLADKNYTIRVFNNTGCHTDKTVLLQSRVCACKAIFCLPYSYRKTK